MFSQAKVKCLLAKICLQPFTDLKSAISDHCKRIMDCDNTRIITSESNKLKRWMKEAIEIRKRAQDTINRDEGAYMLSHTWDSILQKPAGGRGGRV